MNESNEVSDLESELQEPLKAGIVLTAEQQQAVELILKWVEDPLKPIFKLGGYAGTGKTTIIKSIISALAGKYRIVVCAFTGKAVNVLQRKGIPAQTAHSLMYDCEETSPGVYEFFKKPFLTYELIIWDEASMINEELYNDALSFNKKYLFVGDPGQLEPVGDNPELMIHPNFVLSKIHRQAEHSPIITLANNIRTGGSLVPDIKPGLVIQRKQKNLSSEEFLSADQVICAKNKTREDFNRALRQYKKYSEPLVEGEKLICLRNNLNFRVFNGMILYVTKIHGTKKSRRTFQEVVEVDCEDETGLQYLRLPLWKKPFIQELKKDDYAPKDTVHCTYGYVITCHKSQGSEWDKVICWDEWMPPQVWDMKRWRYTAITRAAKELVYNI